LKLPQPPHHCDGVIFHHQHFENGFINTDHPTIFLYLGGNGGVILNPWVGIKVRGYFWKNHKRSINDNFIFAISFLTSSYF